MSLVPPYIESLRPYEAGRTIEDVRRQYGLADVVKLASNENPLGASPLALEAVRAAMDHLNLYPNGGLDLRRVLAREFDLRVENVIAGSGSEGIMSNIIRTFLGDEDEVLTTEAAFIGFQVLARSRGVRYRTVPYRDWHYDLAALAAAITEHLSRESQQSHRHHLHARRVRPVLPARARARAYHSGRSLLRVRPRQRALSRFDALPL
jgi:histidinol-phosphate aminotransferase